MALTYFFSNNIGTPGSTDTLDEETSKHVAQVLRMNAGDKLLLTNGRGQLATASVVRTHKKNCEVLIESSKMLPLNANQTTIAISLLKNASRLEWFLEKATELGVSSIVPLICHRTEKQHYRFDRFQSICRSAMLQSGQSWLPEVHHPQDFSQLILSAGQQQKFIAHCVEVDKKELSSSYNPSKENCIVLIGPEGDFTSDEIALAVQAGFQPVALGKTRLRTETAGIYAAAICR